MVDSIAVVVVAVMVVVVVIVVTAATKSGTSGTVTLEPIPTPLEGSLEACASMSLMPLRLSPIVAISAWKWKLQTMQR